MTVKNTLKKMEREVEHELDELVEDEKASERELIADLDEAAERTRAAAKRMERELDFVLTADAKKLNEIADRFETELSADLDQVALEFLRELDDVLGRARASVRAALARRNAA